MSGRSIHLIDRDELLATLEQDIDVSVTGEENMKAVQKCLQEILDDVKESPVVDAVPVIRCIDCVKWKTDECSMADKEVLWELDYCSYAERKEE